MRDTLRRTRGVSEKKDADLFCDLLEMLRGKEQDFDSCTSGKEVANLLRAQKLVLLAGIKTLTTLFRADVDYEISKQLVRRDRVIASVDEILKAAKKRKLHPVVFKGLAFERCIHGDVARRDAGDLDLLVRKEEILATHKLLLSLGYRQQTGPSSAGGARQSRALAAVRASQNALDGVAGQAEPVRRHPYKGELSPYVRIDSPTIEVHDGFARLPEHFLEDAIKGSRKGLVVDPLYNLVFLLANAYENAESLFSNCFDYGVVLRDCVDIREFWIKYGDTLDWGAAESLIDEVGLRDRTAHVLGDLEEVYGREAVSGLLPGIERVHGYGGPSFLERAHDEETARKIVLPFFRKEVEKEALTSPTGVNYANGLFGKYSSRPVMRFVTLPEKSESLVLEIDDEELLVDDNQLLQISFYYLEGACGVVGYKVTLHRSDAQLQVTGNESRRLLNGAALLKDSGVRLPVSVVEGSGSSHVRVELDDLPETFAKSLKGEGIAVDASVFAHNHSNVYWRRDEPAAVIMDEVAMGNLWLIRDGWNNALLPFDLFDFSIASNDRQLLEDLGKLFSISCMDAMPIASKKPSVCVTVQKDGLDLYSVAASDDKTAKLGLSRTQAVGTVLQLVMDSLVANGVESFSVNETLRREMVEQTLREPSTGLQMEEGQA